MPSDLTDADYAALATFRFSLRKFLSFSEQAATDCGLTPQQHQAMLVIRSAPEEATVGYVAERLILKPHSATGLINRLVAAGLIERRTSLQDKRSAILALTDTADTVLQRLSVAHREEIRRLRPLMTDLLDRLDTSTDG